MVRSRTRKLRPKTPMFPFANQKDPESDLEFEPEPKPEVEPEAKLEPEVEP